MDKNQKENCIPDVLEFNIGGFFGGRCGIEFEEGKLIYSLSERDEIVEVIPSPLDWKIFWLKVKELQVVKWKKKYDNNDICDGTQWELKIKINTKTINSNGSNEYPENFELFLKALSELLGNLPVQ